MSVPIDFWFDFSSRYAYLLSERIDEVAARHGREVRWRPLLMGAVFRETGGQALARHPLKGPYTARDMERSARFLGIPYVGTPTVFPVSSHQACRVFYWLEPRDAAAAHDFAQAVFRAYFVDDLDISQLPVLQAIGEKIDIPRGDVVAAADDDTAKDRLRAACECAIASGVFGSPFVIIDGEPFWGADRLPQIERWLERGGF